MNARRRLEKIEGRPSSRKLRRSVIVGVLPGETLEEVLARDHPDLAPDTFIIVLRGVAPKSEGTDQ